jgi:hypothetical protein
VLAVKSFNTLEPETVMMAHGSRVSIENKRKVIDLTFAVFTNTLMKGNEKDSTYRTVLLNSI